MHVFSVFNTAPSVPADTYPPTATTSPLSTTLSTQTGTILLWQK